MYQITFKWTEGTELISRTISAEQPTKIANTIRLGLDPLLCDIVLQDKINRISRLHAEIFFESDLRTFFIRNLTWNQVKPNVVLVDDKLVTEERVPLYSGNTITLRDIAIQVTIVQLDVTEVNRLDPTLRVRTPTYEVPTSIPSPTPAYQAPTPTPIYQAPTSIPSPTPAYQAPTPVYQAPTPTPVPTVVSSGDLRIESSILQRATKNDEQAIATMFGQFIPDGERIHCVRYLGIQGFWGWGTRQFGCVSDRRIADITIGYFGELTYQDGYLEHINSGVVYQPSKLPLYFLIGLFLAIFPFWIAPFIYILLSGVLGTSQVLLWLSLIISYAIAILLLPLLVRLYYRFSKCGLVLSVREGEIFLNPYGSYGFSHRLVYLFSNRKLITRANALYRSFIICREQRLNLVEQYPTSPQHQPQSSPELTPLQF
jgi:hypothetical protein